MIDINFEPSPKQALAWLYLERQQYSQNTSDELETIELGYGGSGRSGKSWFAISYLIIKCLQCPDTRWGLGRKELKNLKRTSLVTFFKACRQYGLVKDKDYFYNQQDGIIKFANDSQIILLDMAYSPSDPLFLSLGGLELTGAVVEESNECVYSGISILMSRCGNWNNKKYNIPAILIETFNPDKGHVYNRYYVPWKNNQMPKHRRFIKALPADNPYVEKAWLDSMEKADEVTRERLLKGNFDFDADDRALVSYPKIMDCFTNSFVPEGEKRLSSDLAMQGRDNFVIAIWNGLRVKIPLVKNKSRGKEIEEDLKKYAEDYKVPRSKVVVDSDGMGSYIESYMNGIIEFHGGSRAFDSNKYFNLKSECAYKLAELINKGEFYLDVRDDAVVVVNGREERLRDVLVAELSQLKKNTVDKDEKLRIIPKEEMKQNLGRSPDFLDVLIMGCMHLCQNTEAFTLDDTEGLVF